MPNEQVTSTPSKATAGPWSIARPHHYAGTGINIHAGDNGTGAYICSAGQRGDLEAEANAALIAASPDFLADKIDTHREYGTSAILNPDNAKMVVNALRSAARTDEGYVAGFEACREAALNAASHGANIMATDSGYETANRIRSAIAALPAPATAAAGEEVTVEELALALMKLQGDINLTHFDQARALLSTSTITRKSEERV